MIDDLLMNLNISDVAVHEIFKRDTERRVVQPLYAQRLEILSMEAMTAFRTRVTDALSAKAKALEMRIQDIGPGSFQNYAQNAIKLQTPDEFLLYSQKFADALAIAQKNRSLPGGVVIVFRGTSGRENSPFVAVIKAEVQEGFRRHSVDGVLTTEFVNDLFMTKATRLYKIGFMTCASGQIESQDQWKCIVFDHYIALNNREAAAIYFYEGFLGCGFKEDSAYETAKFFNLTKEFAQKNIQDRETRHNLQDSLYTYVKNDQSPTFTVEEFTERHVPSQFRDQYQEFMISRQFPNRAVRRDTTDLKSKLRRRRFKYDGNIELSVPPEAIANGMVTMDVRPEEDTMKNEITQVTIRAPFLKET
ncbi:MAG: nucleoid-associated protein [Cohaesibacter sp.]|jgi:nucleoid-associated protein YejK|nr:nucleoid-associated protein [Cohaesibacter sp.]